MFNKLKNIKLNLWDIILIFAFIFVVSVMVGSYFKNGSANVFSDDVVTKMNVTVETNDIRVEYADNIKVGLPVRDAETGDLYGEIASVDIYDVSAASDDERDFCFARITISCDAVNHGEYYSVNEKKLLVSDVDKYLIPDLYFEGKCISFEKGASIAH